MMLSIIIYIVVLSTVSSLTQIIVSNWQPSTICLHGTDLIIPVRIIIGIDFS